MARRECETKYCYKKAAKHSKFCYACIMRRWRERNPMRAAYENLKCNAKRRGKPFTITFTDFKEFCYKTNYIAGKGRTSESFSIDCKEPDKGYVRGNLQVMTIADNAKKGVKKVLVYDWETKQGFVIKKVAQEEDEDNPF